MFFYIYLTHAYEHCYKILISLQINHVLTVYNFARFDSRHKFDTDHAHAAYPYCMSVQHVHAECSDRDQKEVFIKKNFTTP